MEPMSAGILRDTSQPWALGYRHENNSGNHVGKDYSIGTSEDLDEASRSSSAEGKSVSTRTTDRSDASAVATSITTDLDTDDRNTDSSNNSANKADVAHILPMPSCLLDGPTDGEAALCYVRELTIDDEERDEAENASPGATPSSAASSCATNTAAAHAKRTCLTQPHGCADVRVGFGGEIPRWPKGSVLTYVICGENFPHHLPIEEAMRAAVSKWQNIGVTFKQVGRNDPATFAVTYEKGDPAVYARSFFPNEARRKLTVYEYTTLQAAECLAGILSHELGHILGLRHEFAHARENGIGMQSFLVGSENPQSVMNYFDDPNDFRVQEQDLEELKRFYEDDRVEYGGLLIRDIDPAVRPFDKDDEPRNLIASLVTELR
ncbi:uncharacterized protein Triagg1_8229 [Trichoderma aggressivum f. europaeum]|uniref:Peptidase metallopeptidase domain-containing protein n=1 Tax=Trichoderma aggressivum f. europaeum TaxID=173218 RepID=A0AAE1I8N3_9HYPO|nr:hypothetical protein Triagg1_8229 [Trichoderma aggressivum f. europaeum]